MSVLRTAESEHGYESLFPAILWMGDENGKQFDWAIGFYEKKRIVLDWIVVLDEVKFYIDPADLPKLDGHTLDYVDGKFKILPPQKH